MCYSRNIYLLVILLTLAIITSGAHRMKRKVVFSKNSKLFFRLNGKSNVIPWVEIFANGWGFRINYDLPENLQKRYKFFKRDLHDDYQSIPNEHAQQGLSCVIRYLCEAVANLKNSKSCGMFCGIGDIIANSESMESSYFKSIWNNCDFHADKCPYPLEFINENVI